MAQERGGLIDRLRGVRRVIGRIEGWQVRRFGWSILSRAARTDVLVLETVGRLSGRARSTPVACLRHEDGWLIAGGAGGQRRVDWVANLRAHPSARVVVDRARVDVAATEPDGAEGEQVRAAALARWPQIAVYERRSGRRTPVFVLRPR